ncbi:MAG TPA: hypothetical protein VFH56_00280 [Acidimicrobiales bacterium]|nr:hypothetical protein [Acidimicrobiales bacterium]
MPTHSHFQLNVCKDMHLPDSLATLRAHRIGADIKKAYKVGADTISFNEMETHDHHMYARQYAEQFGYDLFMPHGPSGAIVIAWRKDRGSLTKAKSRLASKGRRGITPNRVVNSVRLRFTDGTTRGIAATQAVSGGYNRKVQKTDPWRRMIWAIDIAKLTSVVHWLARRAEVVFWAGDLNRSRFKFLGLGQLPNSVPTHGPSIYDYVGVVFKRARLKHRRLKKQSVRVIDGFYSDHNGVLAEVEW